MNAAHLHLVLNHAPLFGVLFGALGLAVALLRRSDDMARLSLGLLLIGGLLAVPAKLTGEEAEEIVEEIGGISHDVIHEHEEAGETATIAAGLLGLVALGGLLGFRQRAVPRGFLAAVLLGSLAVGGWVGYTNYLGGQIRHTEIRDGAAADQTEGDHEREPEHEHDG